MHNLLVTALPMSAGRILNIIANFIAMMMVATLGKEQLAASTLAISSYIGQLNWIPIFLIRKGIAGD